MQISMPSSVLKKGWLSAYSSCAPLSVPDAYTGFATETFFTGSFDTGCGSSASSPAGSGSDSCISACPDSRSGPGDTSLPGAGSSAVFSSQEPFSTLSTSCRVLFWKRSLPLSWFCIARSSVILKSSISRQTRRLSSNSFSSITNLIPHFYILWSLNGDPAKPGISEIIQQQRGSLVKIRFTSLANAPADLCQLAKCIHGRLPLLHMVMLV